MKPSPDAGRRYKPVARHRPQPSKKGATMVIHDLAFGFCNSSLPRTLGGVTERTRIDLGALEIRVVHLGASDPASSVSPASSVFSRAISCLFGSTRVNSLANPRLEALRRFSTLSRLFKGHPPDHEQAAMLQAGFSLASIEKVKCLASEAH